MFQFRFWSIFSFSILLNDYAFILSNSTSNDETLVMATGLMKIRLTKGLKLCGKALEEALHIACQSYPKRSSPYNLTAGLVTRFFLLNRLLIQNKAKSKKIGILYS
jgi:hypothetical protein